jgi:hypothetical protein
MKTKIYTDKRMTNRNFQPDWQGKMPIVYIAQKGKERAFGFTKEQALDNLKKLWKIKNQ